MHNSGDNTNKGLLKKTRQAQTQVELSVQPYSASHSPVGNTVAKVMQHFLFGGQLITPEQMCLLEREGTISRTLHNEPCFTRLLRPATLANAVKPQTDFSGAIRRKKCVESDVMVKFIEKQVYLSLSKHFQQAKGVDCQV